MSFHNSIVATPWITPDQLRTLTNNNNPFHRPSKGPADGQHLLNTCCRRRRHRPICRCRNINTTSALLPTSRWGCPNSPPPPFSSNSDTTPLFKRALWRGVAGSGRWRSSLSRRYNYHFPSISCGFQRGMKNVSLNKAYTKPLFLYQLD